LANLIRIGHGSIEMRICNLLTMDEFFSQDDIGDDLLIDGTICRTFCERYIELQNSRKLADDPFHCTLCNFEFSGLGSSEDKLIILPNNLIVLRPNVEIIKTTTEDINAMVHLLCDACAALPDLFERSKAYFQQILPRARIRLITEKSDDTIH
jgi:hypothetical protein